MEQDNSNFKEEIKNEEKKFNSFSSENNDSTTREKGKLKSPIDLIKESFVIFSQKYKNILWLIFIPVIVIASFALIVFLSGIVFINFSSPSLFPLFSILGIIVLIAFIIFFFYLMIWTTSSLYYTIQDPKNTKIIEVYKKSRKYAWSLFVVSLVNIIFIFLWGILFIIPGFVFAVYYSFSKWTFALEGYKGTSALKRSRELVSGYWLQIVFRLAFLLIPYLTIYFLAIILNGSWLAVFMLGILNFALSLFFPSISLIYLYLIYLDLIKIKPESRIKNKNSSKLILAILIIFGLLLFSIPFFLTLSVVSLNNAREKSRDARRLSDVKQIQTALELYYTDVGHYPEKLTPGSIFSLNSTTYMYQVPKNLIPNDGTCPEDFEYTYTYKNNNSYTLDYCLGRDTGQIKKGINTATPDGIN